MILFKKFVYFNFVKYCKRRICISGSLLLVICLNNCKLQGENRRIGVNDACEISLRLPFNYLEESNFRLKKVINGSSWHNPLIIKTSPWIKFSLADYTNTKHQLIDNLNLVLVLVLKLTFLYLIWWVARLLSKFMSIWPWSGE